MNIFRISLVSALALALGLSVWVPAQAHQDLPGCTSTGVVLLLDVYESDGVTPAAAGSPGETLKYQATLSHIGGTQCNYEGGTLTITTPDGTPHVVASPATPVVPLVSFGNPFTSVFVNYVVDGDDAIGGELQASVAYTGGISHRDENEESTGGQSTISVDFEKLDSTTVTELHDSDENPQPNGTEFPANSLVHDEATVDGDGPTPTGNVTFTFFSGAGAEFCDAQSVGAGVVALDGSGVAHPSDEQGPLAPGQYAFRASYAGDDNYEGSLSGCEPFSVAALPLEVTKTVDESFDRDWDWTIEKSADQTDLTLADGELFTVNYEVEVTPTSEDVNHEVTGTITVENPLGNPDATITSITDVLDVSGAAVVDCTGDVTFLGFPHTLGANETLTCTYIQSGADPDDEENTVTVTTSGAVPGDTDTQPVAFGEEDLEDTTDECVLVSDDNPNGPQNVEICEDDGDKTIEYAVDFGTESADGEDVVLICDENEHVNTADFVTNDNHETGEDSWTVLPTVECLIGCTLTQGYWKTHSAEGPAPFDEGWDLLGVLSEDTVFFGSGKTWYEAFWTPVAGKPYYQLAHQYMAAKLNVLNGASPTPAVTQALLDAEALFANPLYDTPAEIDALKGKNANAVRQQFTTLAGILGSFNEGTIGPGHCDEDETSQLPS